MNELTEEQEAAFSDWYASKINPASIGHYASSKAGFICGLTYQQKRIDELEARVFTAETESAIRKKMVDDACESMKAYGARAEKAERELSQSIPRQEAREKFKKFLEDESLYNINYALKEFDTAFPKQGKE